MMGIDLTTAFMIAAVAVPAAIAFFSGLYTIPQEHKGLVTRFGKHVRTNDDPGLKFKIPLIESVKRISQQEQVVHEELETKTKKGDDVTVKLPIAIHFQVKDPATFHFKKTNPIQLMNDVVNAAIREYTAKKTFQEIYDERAEIKHAVLEKVKEQVEGYGIHINDIIINEPKASDEMKAKFDRVRTSALELEAAQNDAQAEYIKAVKNAEAVKERNILIGEGVAGFREKIATGYSSLRKKLIADGVDPETADRFMEEAMRLDTLRDIGDKGNMVIVTQDGGSAKNIAELQALGATLKRPAHEQNNHRDDAHTTAPVPTLAAGPG